MDKYDEVALQIVGAINSSDIDHKFDDEIQIVLNKFSKYIHEKSITTTLYLAHNTRSFLYKKNDYPMKIVYHTSKDKQEKIDKFDNEIIKLLANNARISIVKLSQSMKTTPRIVQYRIKELERKKIILGYKAQIEPKTIKRIFCKALIYLTNTKKENIDNFIDYASSLPGAVWPQRILGNWDFELDLELENYDEFQDVMLNLREKFPSIIKDYEFCLVSKEFKLDLFPGAFPQFKNNTI